ARRRARRARPLAGAGARVRRARASLPERRAAARGARGADARRGEPGLVMAVLDRIETLEPIREKVEAGERLDFEDGVALFESDDLLGLGELADLARRLRGGDDRVFFVQNLHLYQPTLCRANGQFWHFAETTNAAGAY